MLWLLFQVENNRYALDSRQVTAVASMVNLRKIPQSPPFISGVFHCKNKIVPAVDLSQLLIGKPSKILYSTRIILIDVVLADKGTFTLGLIAEKVVDTVQKAETELMDSDLTIEDADYLGKFFFHEEETIQCITVDHLISESVRDVLINQQAGQ